MRRIAMILFMMAHGCATQRRSVVSLPSPTPIFNETFEDASEIARSWRADVPRITGAAVRQEREAGNGFMSLVLPEGRDPQDLALHRSIDLIPWRGHRVRISARVRVQTSGVGSAHVRLSIPASEGETYSDIVDSAPVAATPWRTRYAVVDVPSGATRGDIQLSFAGGGTASFDDITISTFGPSPASTAAVLSKPMIERLTTLGRTLALVRYFHPSDQSASLDWNDFSIRAIRAVLTAPESRDMRDILTGLFTPIAPTARIASVGLRPTMPRDDAAARSAMVRDPRATHLVRWHHVGLGSDDPDNRYHSFRDGIGADEATAYLYATVMTPGLPACHHAEIRAAVHAVTGAPWIFVSMYQAANRVSYIRQAIAGQHHTVVIAHGDVPPDIRQMKVGFSLAGRSFIELSNVSIHCDHGEAINLDAHAAWEVTRDQDLYEKTITGCGSETCVVVKRSQSDTQIDPDRDVLEVDLGSNVHMSLPLAVWSDGHVTFPEAPVPSPAAPDYTVADLPVRLAAVVTTWNTLLWFYPYFADQHLDWASALPGALEEAAAATSTEQLHHALSRLITKLRDGHAHVRHPTHSLAGMLPFSLHRFGQRIYVIGGLASYMQSIPVGSELVSVDNIAASDLYASNATLVSAATPQFQDYLATLYTSIGPIGALRHVRIRSPSGGDVDAVLPLISREKFDPDIHLRHPESGSQIAPSVFYVDASALESSGVPKLIHALGAARAVILDGRGHVRSATFEFLAHFISRAVKTPQFRAPVVTVRPHGEYQDWGWNLWPAEPQLECRLIVLTEARAVSAGETLLQMIHDNHLATIVGEPTAGTNGDVNTFYVPGGFSVRFTGLRASGPDGSTIQGHGIVPDHIVHPTIDGIRAGRDEVLEAAVSLAR